MGKGEETEEFRRMNRVCAHYGVSPILVFCSATVGNPSELTSKLSGLNVQAVTKNSAPHGRKHVIFINPEDGAAQTAIKLLRAALHRGLRATVYTQSRKLAELINIWVSQRAGSMAERISAYRACYLPEERREIERRLSSGELLAVISTSALELGIDIGSLDLCLLVGYPGTVMATWQRGGRVGLSRQAFEKAEELLQKTLKVIENCPCELGGGKKLDFLVWSGQTKW